MVQALTILKLLLNIQMHSPCLQTSLMFLWEENGRNNSEGLKGESRQFWKTVCSPRSFKWLAKLHFVKSSI